MNTGPDEQAARGRMRAGHADREQVISELKAAFVQGRLDQDELGERAGRAVTSRTYAELDALTADIPAPVPAAAASGGCSPGRTLARAAKRAAICLLAAAALAEAAFLAGNFLLIVAAFFAAIAASGFIGYGIIDAVRERHARERRTTGPGPGDGGTGSAGGPPGRGLVPPGDHGLVPPGDHGLVPPGDHGGQGMAESRARRPRPTRALQRGWAVS